MEELFQFLHEPLSYIYAAMLGVIGWLIADKFNKFDDRLKDLVSKTEGHLVMVENKIELHNNQLHEQTVNLLKFQLQAQDAFVSKAEYIDTTNRLYSKLDKISDDIQDILKAER